MRSSTRYILMILGVIIVIIIAVLLFNAISRTNSNKSTDTPADAPASLSTYADTSATVSYTIDGEITGNEQYRAIKIIVSNTGRTIQVLSGYQGQILKSQTTANNTQAYQQFLAAIENQGYLNQKQNSAVTDISGQCPLGNRYIVATTGVPNIPTSLWSSSCGTKIGTWGGNNSTVSKLFQMQIPNYSQFVSGVVL